MFWQYDIYFNLNFKCCILCTQIEHYANTSKGNEKSA